MECLIETAKLTGCAPYVTVKSCHGSQTSYEE